VIYGGREAGVVQLGRPSHSQCMCQLVNTAWPCTRARDDRGAFVLHPNCSGILNIFSERGIPSLWPVCRQCINVDVRHAHQRWTRYTTACNWVTNDKLRVKL